MNLIPYDLIIIGGGPAGAAAAVYASRKRLNTLFITAEFGGQSVVSKKIYNWIGTTEITGAKLASNLKDHVMANSGEFLKVKEGLKVNNISKENDPRHGGANLFKIKTNTGEEFETKTILIATGSKHRKLEAKNADKFEHKGLTYCATCDGPLFSDTDVVVIGGGNAAFESASQLLAYCSSVTLLNRSDTFRANEITIEKLSKNPKFKILKNIDILEIKGDKFVEGILIKPARNAFSIADAGGDKNIGIEKASPVELQPRELKVAGIFIEIGQIPNTDFVKDIVPLDKIGRIKIDPWTGKTETPGIWAAGDCTNVLYHQNNIAAGDAVKALEDIYLAIHTK